MTSLVSILIPAYNAERWIADSIASAVAQTSWKAIIVVADGSADGTLAPARRLAAAEVAVVTQSNQGAAGARNRAFSLCRAGAWDTSLAVDDDGEYFCRVLLASDGVRFVPGHVGYIGRSPRKVECQFRSMRSGRAQDQDDGGGLETLRRDGYM